MARPRWDEAAGLHSNVAARSALRKLGWRLPTKKELETLVDVRVPPPGPFIDATAFPNTAANCFWTSTPEADSSRGAWNVDFSAGSSRYADTPNTYDVRCVH